MRNPLARRKSWSTASPTARITVSHSRRRISSVGTGLRRPEASDSPSRVLTTSLPFDPPSPSPPHPRLDHFHAFDAALLIAHNTVRRRQEHELRALLLRRIRFLTDGRHVLALAAVDDGHLGPHAERGARRIDGRIEIGRASCRETAGSPPPA